MDRGIRDRERRYAATGDVGDLDALDHAQRRAGLPRHPDADDIRLREMTRAVVLAGYAVLGRAAERSGIALGKSLTEMSLILWAFTRLNRLVARLDGRDPDTLQVLVLPELIEEILHGEVDAMAAFQEATDTISAFTEALDA